MAQNKSRRADMSACKYDVAYGITEGLRRNNLRPRKTVALKAAARICAQAFR